MIGLPPIGSPTFMCIMDAEQNQLRKSLIEQIIVDIKAGPHNHAYIEQVLSNYGLTEDKLSDAECRYINKMINS